MGLVLELWDNFEFFADVPTCGCAVAVGCCLCVSYSINDRKLGGPGFDTSPMAMSCTNVNVSSNILAVFITISFSQLCLCL